MRIVQVAFVVFLGLITAQLSSGVLPPHARRSRDNGYNNENGQPRNLQVVAEETADTAAATTTTAGDPEAEQTLRQQLLSNYDRGSFPFVALWENQNGTRTGLPVELGLNFHRVLQVDPTSSVVDMIVWVRQRWNDPRLAWDPAQHNGIKKIHFWVADGSGPGGETSEIWTPDLELWNNMEPLAQSLVSTNVVVSSDGTAFWSRPGHVKPVCKFSGLSDFPFDTLRCTLEIGSWSYSGLYLRPTKLDGVGFSIGGSETAGEAYQEFDLGNIECEEHVYPPFVNAPLENWPVLFYHVSFHRSWQPYARGFIALQVILNLFAFTCFWLPPHVGERMSLSITAVLAAVASELVVAAKLPAAAELTWFAKFSIVSLLFTALALIESAAVIYFYYLTADDLVPSWYRWLEHKILRKEDVKPAPSDDQLKLEFEEAQETDETQPIGQGNGHQTDQEDEVKTDRRNPSFRSSLMFDESLPKSSRMGSVFTSDSTVDEPQKPDHRMSMSLAKHLSSFRTRKSIKTILGRDADDFKNGKEMANNAKWQRVANKLDEVSRVMFPVLFAIFVTTAFARAK